MKHREQVHTETSYFTKEGLAKVEEELRLMKTKGRADMARQIQEAREKGDLSENAEYDAAKEAQGMMEAKIAILENTLAHSKIIDESSVDTSKVMIMSTVLVMNHSISREIKYKIVSETEANFKEGKISVKSPIGKGLLGKIEGEIVEVEVPAGAIRLEILKITREG